MGGLKRTIKSFKNGFKLSAVSKINWQERLLVVLTVIYPLIFLKANIFGYLVFLCIYISLSLVIRDRKKEQKKNWSKLYKLLFVGSLLIQCLGVILLTSTQSVINKGVIEAIIGLTVASGMLLYISVVLGILFYIFNLIFYIILKMIFPQEAQISNELRVYSLNELSKYTTIQEQISYFILMVIHYLIYCVLVTYIFLFLVTELETYQGDLYLSKLGEWVTAKAIISFGNGLGLLSIVITILTITVPSQMRISNKAIDRHIENEC